MSDGTLYVSFNNPKGIGLFEPELNRLGVWVIGKSPGEFVAKEPRLFFNLAMDRQMAWFRPDVGFFRFWQLPSYSARPTFLLDGAPGSILIEIYYLDWGTGRVGLLAPTESGQADLRDVKPRRLTSTPTSFSVTANVRTVADEVFPGNPNVAPAVRSVNPTINAPFTEWQVLSPNDPAYGFARGNDGQIWVSGAASDPLYALDPWNHILTMHDLPGTALVTGLTAGSFNEMWFLSRTSDDATWLGVLDSGIGTVRLWPIPDASDAIGLRMIDREIWFLDRGTSAIYRFDPAIETFTWWLTGGDDAPLYIVPGASDEYWISFERSGAIVRMELP